MKILIVSQYYFPEQFQINEIAPELVKRGHEVTVLTGLPNYPKGEVYEGYRHGEKRDERINGVHVIRCKIHPRKHGPVHLLMNYFSYARHAEVLAKGLKDSFDIVLCYQLSPVLMLKPAIAYAAKNHTPLLGYCLDIWPESAQSHLKTDKGLLYRYISKISRKYYSACDHIAVTSRPFIAYLSQKNGINPNKMSYLPQHADESCLHMDLSAPENKVTDFMYAGNMGAGQTLDVLIKAAAEIKNRDFILHMVGDGSKRQELEKLAADLGIRDKVVFYGNQKRENMPDMYRKADALLISLRGNNAVGDTMPGKLQTYMTVRKPILGAINGAAKEVILEAQCGDCVPAGDYQGLAARMEDFIDQPQKYASCGQNAAAYFLAHFTLMQYIDDLEKLMKTVVTQYDN